MREVSVVLLLASAYAVVTATNHSDDVAVDFVDADRCECISYPQHLPFNPDHLPDAKLLRQLANHTALLLASLIPADGKITDDTWDMMSEQARSVLEKNANLAATSLVTNIDKYQMFAYHQVGNGNVFILEYYHGQKSCLQDVVRDSDFSRSVGQWTSMFWDCSSRQWMLGYSVPLSKQNRGLVGVYQFVDRCNDSTNLAFDGGHKCDYDTTECVPGKAVGIRPDAGYTCACRPGYFHNASDNTDESSRYRCVPCPSTCPACDAEGECPAVTDFVLRASIVGVQAICMAATLVLGVVVFRKRKCKTISTGMWTILETILLGIFILYGTVVVKFFKPSKEQCLLEPWCRELGFVICYGAIILKLYRILIEFRTRKAHRWVVRDKDLLKYLLGMIVMAVGYMSAWTAATLNFIQEDYSILTTGATPDGVRFVTCKPLWWDYVTQTGEILILVFGIHLSFACRNATTQFQERRFLCLAIVVEATVSGVYYVLRAVYSESLHPDYTYIAFFVRSQLTSTIVLMLIFIPKLWYQQKQVTDLRGVNSTTQEASARLPMDAFKPTGGDGAPGSNSDVELGDVNLADMNPEDIRAELKRLYTQLEVLKNKTIRTDNPHISKRRGGRKVAHRRFSLQKKGSREKALHHRHQRYSTRHHGHDHEGAEGEVSRTPEDSVCSVEGPSAIFNDGPSTYSDMGYATPNVSNRAGHKQ